MDRQKFFEMVMTVCDWEQIGKDDKVLYPLITHLSQQSDKEIFAFDEQMAELLFELDTKKNFQKACQYYNHSDDTFLYSRCCALTNGEAYYNGVKAGKISDLWTMEFESILYVPRLAWAKKHQQNSQDYPYLTAQSYETGSNTEKWND